MCISTVCPLPWKYLVKSVEYLIGANFRHKVVRIKWCGFNNFRHIRLHPSFSILLATFAPFRTLNTDEL